MTETVKPRRGRPRSVGTDLRVHDAVVSILDTVGYVGLRIDDVAELASVSKTTIYRRWPTKSALVVHVLATIKAVQVPMPTSGDFETDLRSLIYDLYASLADTSLGRALPGLVVEKSADPELAAAVEALWSTRQAQVAKVIRRGIASGQARADLDVRATLELLAASAYYRLLVTGASLDRRSARRHADAIVEFIRAPAAFGMTAAASTATPAGAAPTRPRHAGRRAARGGTGPVRAN